MQASLSAGKIVMINEPKSIADGLIPASVGDLTLEACQKNVDGMFSVTDDEILSSMKQLIQEAHIFPEPSGSAPLAVLSKPENLSKLGDRVVVVVSGGNVSLSLLNRLLS
jgi:threonine dehydratase